MMHTVAQPVAAFAPPRSLAQKPARSAAPARAAASRVRSVRPLRIVAASAASFGGAAGGGEGEVNVFPRFKERDPYRVLGVDKEATYEEIQEARNFLVSEHKSHVRGVEVIEMAFDKIINEKLKERQKTKGIKLDKKKKPGDDIKISLGPLDAIRERWVVPDQKTITQRLFVFAFLAMWSLYQSAQSGPAFQVAVGFGLCAYFVYEKRPVKNLGWAAGQAFIGLFSGLILGSIVPVFLPIFPPMMAPETIASMFAFFTLFMATTFFK